MLTGPGIAALIAIAILAGFAGRKIARRLAAHRRALADLAKLAEAKGSQPLPVLVAQVAARLDATDDRLSQRHAGSGLPTREPLLATIAADAGQLAIFEFADFDRLAAFDPALAKRIAAQLGRRLAAMAGARPVAHVDRHRFAVWFAATPDAGDITNQVEALRYALSDRLDVDGRELVPEIRAARVAHDPAVATPADSLARGMARTSHIASVELSDPAEDARDRFALEQDLRAAIDRNGLALRFQPLIDATAGTVCGAEALLRWHHPVRGAISPATFIPIAEHAGLIGEIGLWVLNAACREARRWQRAGLGNLRVAVNVSSPQIARDDMLPLIDRTLARHRLAPAALEIELTESAATADTDRVRTLFAALRARGIRIAIDDFGTGFSSLSALRTLTFDKLKIDREFVTEVDRRRDSQAICQSIIALGRGLGIAVLAEGVERPEEYAWLRRHGCTAFQGYHFSPPLTGDDFLRFAADRPRLTALLATGPQTIQQTVAKRLS